MDGHESSVLCFCAMYRHGKSLPDIILNIKNKTSLAHSISDDVKNIGLYILGEKGEYTINQIATGDYFIKCIDQQCEDHENRRKERIKKAEEELADAKRAL